MPRPSACVPALPEIVHWHLLLCWHVASLKRNPTSDPVADLGLTLSLGCLTEFEADCPQLWAALRGVRGVG